MSTATQTATTSQAFIIERHEEALDRANRLLDVIGLHVDDHAARPVTAPAPDNGPTWEDHLADIAEGNW